MVSGSGFNLFVLQDLPLLPSLVLLLQRPQLRPPCFVLGLVFQLPPPLLPKPLWENELTISLEMCL